MLADGTSQPDTVYGRIPAGLLEPNDDVSIVGDTIFKDDTLAIGTLIEPEEADSTSGERVRLERQAVMQGHGHGELPGVRATASEIRHRQGGGPGVELGAGVRGLRDGPECLALHRLDRGP